MNGDRVRRAREIKGWTQQELADAVKVTQAAIARLERNAFTPSTQLEQQIALATGFPLSFFHQHNTIDFPLGSLLFRQHMNIRSRERDQILGTAWATYVLYRHMIESARLMPLRLPRVEKESVKRAALLTRNALGLEPDKPVYNLVNRLEKAGVVVLSIPLDIHAHDAFSLWSSNQQPIIVLSHGKSGDRQRFTTAHELGHLVQHYVLWGSHDEVEREANAFAEEFLLPEDAIREEMAPPVTLSGLAELKVRWGVSVAALIERACHLKIISADQKKYLQKQIKIQWRGEEPINLNIEAEKPRALRKMAELFYKDKQGCLNHQKIAHDTSLSPNLVMQILAVHSGKPLAPISGAEVKEFRRKESPLDPETS